MRIIQLRSAFIMLLLAVQAAGAATITGKSGTAAFPFLKLGLGARAASMGGSYTALCDDVNALFWNPAGIAQVKSRQVTANTHLWLDSLSRYNIGYVQPGTRFGALGLGINYLSIPVEGRTGETDESYTSIAAYDMTVTLGWAREFSEKLIAGAGLKYISENLDVKTNTGFALDLGGLYRAGETLQYGLSVQNIGTASSSDPMPMLLRAGAAKRLMEKRLALVGDLEYGLTDGTSSLGLGGEYALNKTFAPRLGYRHRLNNSNFDTSAGLSAGFGVAFNMFRLDYAFSPNNTLGSSHRIDFLFDF